jgi:DNA-binding MarR family transcriptional regulator
MRRIGASNVANETEAPRTSPQRVRQLPWDPVAAAERDWIDHGWKNAASGMAAVTSVLRAQRLYQANVDALLKPLRLNSSRYEVTLLLFFARRGTLPLGVISDRLQLTPATVTNLVDRLVHVGYVVRSPNPLDGRGRLASLTELGHEVAEKATQLMNTTVFETINLDRDEVAHLNVLLWKLRQSFG